MDDRAAVTFPLDVGDMVLAFTDGLIERRDEDIDVGQARVVDAAAALAKGPLAERLEQLATAIQDHTRSDDVAAIAVRRLR